MESTESSNNIDQLVQQLTAELDQHVFAEDEKYQWQNPWDIKKVLNPGKWFKSTNSLKKWLLLRTWLEMNDTISLKFIHRRSFNLLRLRWEWYLTQISAWSENKTDSYILSLPHDLTYGELIGVIEQINQTIHIKEFATIERKLKHQLAIIIAKVFGNITDPRVLQSLTDSLSQKAKHYGISDKLIHSINELSSHFHISWIKELTQDKLRDIIDDTSSIKKNGRVKWESWTYTRWKRNIISNIPNELSKSLNEVILKRWYQKIWKEFMTLSQDEMKKHIESLRKDPDKVVIYFQAWRRYVLKEWEEVPINSRVLIINSKERTEYEIDKQEKPNTDFPDSLYSYRPLSSLDTIIESIIHKVDIVNMKEKFDKHRNNNEGDLRHLTKDCINTLMAVVYTYTWWKEGYTINTLISHKTANCVWKSIIMSCLLSYLGIPHYACSQPQHVSIMIKSWSHFANFDPTANEWNSITPQWTDGSVIEWIYGSYGNEETINFQIWESQDTLMSIIRQSKWYHLWIWKQYKEAIACCDQAITLNPKNYSAWWNKWLYHYQLKQYKEAIACYNQAIIINPGEPKYWHSKWLSHRNLWEKEKCEECEQKWLLLDPQKPFYWYNKANRYLELNKLREADKYYDQAITLNPKEPKYRYSKMQCTKDKRCKLRYYLIAYHHETPERQKTEYKTTKEMYNTHLKETERNGFMNMKRVDKLKHFTPEEKIAMKEEFTKILSTSAI